MINSAWSDDCQNTSREQFFKINQEMYREYAQIDEKASINPNRLAIWIEGDPSVSKAIFLAHGFMGTPAEMMFITEPLKKAGWTIIGFLIPGHGSTTKVANSFKADRWKKAIKVQLELVTNCFQEVRAVGFSTGGLLLHDYLSHNPIPNTLVELDLISPYFLARIPLAFGELLEMLFDNISIDTTYLLTRFPDLKVMTIDRDKYSQHIPIGTALEIKKLGENVFNEKKVSDKLKIPVQLFLSENDWTADINVSKKFIEDNYTNVKNIWYKNADKMPHHLMNPSVSFAAKELQTLIAAP